MPGVASSLDMSIWTPINAMDPSYPWLHSDSLREREFYKYYDPIKALAEYEPSVTDIFADAAEQAKPRSSPDAALTAFCQLGALRIGVRRCMLMFFDREYAYVLAEATKTLSLQDDDIHEVKDDLWLGFTIFRRGLTICEHTINTTPVNWQSGVDPCHCRAVYVVNDLGSNVNFCDRPFVKGGPKARFYAGVPITTPAGVRIGAYCVLDDKPRDGLSPVEVDFMCHMSKTVMSHLEIVRARSDLGIGTNMLTGLGNLVSNSSAGVGRQRMRKRPLPTRRPPYGAKTTPDAVQPASHTQRPSVSGVSMPFKKENVDPANPDGDFDALRKDGPLNAAESALQSGFDPGNARLEMARSAGDAKQIYQTAAELLRKSVQVDGSLILDASTHAYGGAVRPNSPDSENDIVFNDTSGCTTPDKDIVAAQVLDQTPCKVLGSSSATVSGLDQQIMSENFLRDLLKKYPRGKVWNFHSGDSPSSEDGGDGSQSTGIPVSCMQDVPVPKERPSRKDFETQELQRLFPGAQGLCLVGMWDAIRERWCAGTLIWTHSRSRVFSSNTELVFLIAFCDVLMAEITRLESHLESKAKSDFISSVSHELRSPLQGILCGVDLLAEQQSADMPIVKEIEACGTTLLEVINNLLEFAKINNLSNKSKSTKEQLPRKKASSHRDVPLETMTQSRTELHSFAKITEEVCDSTFYSHSWSKERESATNVDFVVDIAMDASVQSSLDVGAWKRICINVINNALKYTQKGYVMASLRISSSENGPALAVLSVTDTGCGMSTEFLKNRLFRPFQQEDDLVQGTGLGMSLVSKLVDGLGGKIEVESQKNLGTTITISVPVDSRRLSLNDATVSLPCDGVRMSFFEPPRTQQGNERHTGRKLLRATLERSYQRLGALTTSFVDSDVNLVFEGDLHGLNVRESARSTIVLCDSFSSAHKLRKSFETQKPRKHIECIAQPYGPMRLANAIQACVPASQKLIAVNGDLGSANGMVILESGSNGIQPTVQSPQPLSPLGEANIISPPVLSQSEIPQHSHAEEPIPPYTNSMLVTCSEKLLREPIQVALKASTPPVRPNVIPCPTSSILGNGKPLNDIKASGITLLLVDDNPVNLRMLVAYADKNAYHRLTADNGQEAVSVYQIATTPNNKDEKTNDERAHRPMVILLDINMPIMDGFEAARQIRLFERNNNIQPATIIAVTGLGSTEAWKEAHASGMDLFLTKPVRPRELTNVLASLGATPSARIVPSRTISMVSV